MTRWRTLVGFFTSHDSSRLRLKLSSSTTWSASIKTSSDPKDPQNAILKRAFYLFS
jgi:hypothetical protein